MSYGFRSHSRFIDGELRRATGRHAEARHDFLAADVVRQPQSRLYLAVKTSFTNVAVSAPLNVHV